jgi:transmembrane sensor
MIMEAEEKDQQFTELATRYLAGEATPEEIQILSGWVNTDPVKKELFHEFHRTWIALQGERVERNVNADTEWENFLGRLPRPSVIRMRGHSATPVYLSRRFLRVAAILLALLVPAWFLIQMMRSPHMEEVVASTGVTDVILPDGSTVTLYKGSSLSYPKKFAGHSREVTMKGEGCFDVKHEPSRPFVVISGDVRVKVLGTSFYMNSKSDSDQVVVILQSGKVSAYYGNDPNRQVTLAPGEKAELSREGHSIVKSVNGDPTFMAWKTRRIVFSNTTLSEIVRVLDKVYQARITLASPSLSSCTLSATFDQQTLPQVLSVMEATLGIKAITGPDGIQLSGTACD